MTTKKTIHEDAKTEVQKQTWCMEDTLLVNKATEIQTLADKQYKLAALQTVPVRSKGSHTIKEERAVAAHLKEHFKNF